MPRKQGAIICDAERMPAAAAGDRHDVSGHHRYHGSSPVNGGERIVETRRRRWTRWLRFFGV